MDFLKNMSITKLKSWLNTHGTICDRINEIERMDKSGLSLDEQEALLIEYNNLWEKLSKMNKRCW